MKRSINEMLADRRLRNDNLYAQVRGVEGGAAPGTAGVGTLLGLLRPVGRAGLLSWDPQSDGTDTVVLV